VNSVTSQSYTFHMVDTMTTPIDPLLDREQLLVGVIIDPMNEINYERLVEITASFSAKTKQLKLFPILNQYFSIISRFFPFFSYHNS